MSVPPDRLLKGLDTLGAMLDAMGSSVELAVVGGGALLLSGLHVRPTEDIDVVALRDGHWQPSSSLPADVIDLLRHVGEAVDLPIKQSGKGNDWLNVAPSFLMPDDLPEGFFERTTVHTFGGLILHVPAAIDLVALKVLAATRTGRGDDRQKDILDLVTLAPRGDDLVHSLRWVSTRRPTNDFWRVRGHTLLDALAVAGLGEQVEDARARLLPHEDAS